jgi:hypothetical protein
MIGEALEDIIKETVKKTLSNKNFIPDVKYLATDNLGEMVEKLAILHIRTWMLEDAIQETSIPIEIANLKKKIDICFKIKRPKLVQAINLLVDDAIRNNTSLSEESVKLYKGIDNG